MKDLTDPRWIKLKGLLFLLIGVSSTALLLAMHFDALTSMLLVIAIWSFCRAYYFAFYVIEKYVDGRYRFSGLGSFGIYLWQTRSAQTCAPTQVASDITTNDEPPA
jgi:hypothetical protein